MKTNTKKETVIIYLDPLETGKFSKIEGKAELIKILEFGKRINGTILEYWEVKFKKGYEIDESLEGLIAPRWIARLTNKSKIRA